MAEGKNEPIRLPAYQSGFVFLPTAGMRLAPEVLVLELFREVCFAKTGGATKRGETAGRPLDPDSSVQESHLANRESLAAVYALRGRKLERGGGVHFYAPAYPELASLGWLRQKSDRVVRDFFLKGALAVASGCDEIDSKELCRLTISAIYGRSLGKHRDVFSTCSEKVVDAEPPLAEAEAQVALGEHLKASASSWGLARSDSLSLAIARDWMVLCRLEPFLPRLSWIGLVSTFLRTTIPIWLLAQMRVTVIARNALRDAIGGKIVSGEALKKEILERHTRLLIPSLTLTEAVDDLVVDYMRSRCEMNLTLVCLSESSASFRKKLESPMTLELEAGSVAFGEVLDAVRALGQKDPNLQQKILRGAEKFPAWVHPLSKGQGKNIEEFLRVLRNDHVGGSDDGYLLARGPKNRRLFRMFPAPAVLSMFTVLTHARKSLAQLEETRLLLTDVEKSFREVGIDFSIVGGCRAHLLKSLAGRGILSGTPDAGEGVELANPYLASVRALLGSAP